MKTIKILFLLFITSYPLFAQGGSLYSGYGIGDLQTSYSARRLGFGELGIALSDKDFVNSLNPAAWSDLRLSRYELSLTYSGSQLQSTSESVFYDNVHFNGFVFGFPMEHDLGISLVMGVVPYSNVRYDVIRPMYDNLIQNYNLEDIGSGGLSRFFIGTSYKLPFGFSLGLDYDYYFGRIETSTYAYFPDSSGYSNSAFIKDAVYHGMSFTAGLITCDIAPLFGSSKIKDFRFGITYTPEININIDTTNNTTTSIGNVVTSSGNEIGNIPYRIGIGSTLTYNDSYTFMVDYLYQPFSQFSQNGILPSSLQDYYKLSVGFEYRNADNKSTSFWDYVLLRAGISYEQTPFKINGTGINQASVYGGFSLPLAFDNSIDFAFQYGRRGTKDNGLILENIYKFNVSLSFGELWFLRADR